MVEPGELDVGGVGSCGEGKVWKNGGHSDRTEGVLGTNPGPLQWLSEGNHQGSQVPEMASQGSMGWGLEYLGETDSDTLGGTVGCILQT